MIQRIEQGRAQVNDALSKRQGRQRRRPTRPRGRQAREEKAQKPLLFRVTIDLIA